MTLIDSMRADIIKTFNEELITMESFDMTECPNCGYKYAILVAFPGWLECNRCFCNYAEWITQSREEHFGSWGILK